jgi:septum formation protein
MQNAPLILASTSPRRRELIRLFGLDFRYFSADIDEAPRPGEAPDALVWRLSRAKAAMGVQHAEPPDAIIIGADTDVAIDGAILGKPTDATDAVRMLKLLRGRAHTVYSGVTVAQGARQLTQIIKTIVWMRDYGDGDIAAYVATGDPLDKAAAYAIQHETFHPVERIEGCHANVMGLPLCHLYRALKEFGVAVDEPDQACQKHLAIVCPVARAILSDH